MDTTTATNDTVAMPVYQAPSTASQPVQVQLSTNTQNLSSAVLTAQTNAQLVSKKGNTIQGSSFTPIEDVAIAKAWVAASEDAIVGTEQKGNAFYGKIQELFNSKFRPSNRELRSMESIKTRCKTTHKECMRFSGCFARIVRSHPTGVSHMDMITMATALYNGVQINSVQDDCGKGFKFTQAWRVLKGHRKFIVALEGSSKADNTVKSSSSPAKSTSSGCDSEKSELDEEAPDQTTEKGRPIGRKRAKEAAFKKEETAKKLRIAAQAVAAQQERNKA